MSRDLTLLDIKLFLAHLLDRRGDLFQKTATATIYMPALREKQAEIAAVPAALLGGLPLKDALSASDKDHDGYGGAAFDLFSAYERAPDTSDELRAAVKRLRETFIPSLGVLTARYPDEAQAAKDRAALLGAHEADLKRFPVAGGRTAYDWVKAYLDAGVAIDRLLSERADQMPASREGTKGLRGSTIALINRTRAALKDEVAVRGGAFPKDIEARLFNYFDLLVAQRSAGSTEEIAAPDEPAAPKPPPARPSQQPAPA